MSQREWPMMITIVLNQDTQEKATVLGRYDRAINVPEGTETTDEISRE
jgi:hypothetical protein